MNRNRIITILAVIFAVAALVIIIIGTWWGRGADSGPTRWDSTLTSSSGGHGNTTTAKPVIYLYPEAETDVTVRLGYDGTLDFTYPLYDGGWSVTALPGGHLINKADGREYSYLFWEGRTDAVYDLSEGFVVPGAQTAAFLQEKLALMGLEPREYNEFIVYWLPFMQNNAYNLISFQGDAYTSGARLEIDPAPDSVLRVFMAFKQLEAPVEIPAQELSPFERRGFTVVEWGGALVAD